MVWDCSTCGELRIDVACKECTICGTPNNSGGHKSGSSSISAARNACKNTQQGSKRASGVEQLGGSSIKKHNLGKKLTDLKSELVERGLSTQGMKIELVCRLTEAMTDGSAAERSKQPVQPISNETALEIHSYCAIGKRVGDTEHERNDNCKSDIDWQKGWPCKTCTFINTPQDLHCQLCQQPSPYMAWAPPPVAVARNGSHSFMPAGTAKQEHLKQQHKPAAAAAAAAATAAAAAAAVAAAASAGRGGPIPSKPTQTKKSKKILSKLHSH